ncbi:MAG: LodA/GoxA family CTQ-dependent oxidase [Verrucomicrobiales bacterium]
MAFPDDLTDVAALKIHPAIGVARIANNDDYYEFFDYEEKRKAGQAQTLEYMSVQNGKHWMKRQAVQFKIFAYADGGQELGELTSDIMIRLGLLAKWTAKVANRKLHNWRSSTPVVEAQATAEGAEDKRLEGSNPWRPTEMVWLGNITGEGLFIPPKGGAYRKTANTKIPPYGSHQRDNDVLDTTSDGSISVNLEGSGSLPVVPASVVVAPQDHSPDVYAADIEDGRNTDFVKNTRTLLNIAQNAVLTGVGYQMDLDMMRTMNAEYSPGMEICLNPGNSLPNPAGAFYPRGQQHIAPAEIRPSYEAGHAVHGALTAGLCSTWQTDLNACLDYWTAEFPAELTHATAPTARELSRKNYGAAGPRMGDPEDLNAYIDMMGVGRNVVDDIDDLHEKERTSADIPGATPQAPFPLTPTP